MASTTAKRKNNKPATMASAPMKKWEDESGTIQLNVLEQSNDIIEIPLEQIKPHAHNRKLDSDTTIDELAESIKAIGQFDAATVRKTGDAKFPFELLSGERRFRALKKLGRSTIRATVVSDTVNEALIRMAAANTNRRDLDAIERAELIVKLMQPIEAGGAGLDRAAAGRAVGLGSDSGTKNALRILRLPDGIRDMVRKGNLSERAARKLVPFVDIPALIEAIAEDLIDNENRIELMSCEDLPYWMEMRLNEHTRPMDDREIGSWMLFRMNGFHPMLFNPDEEQKALLDPREFQCNGQKFIFTTNTTLWDKLQLKALSKRLDDGDKPGPSKATKMTKATEAKLSEKEQAAAEKAKLAEADARLKKYTEEWTSIALRCQLAQPQGASDQQILATLGFLTQAFNRQNNGLQPIALSYDEAGMGCKSLSKGGWGEPLRLPHDASNASYLYSWWRLMLWPVSIRPNAPKELSKSGELPSFDNLFAKLQREHVLQLSQFCRVSIADFWRDAAGDGPQRQLVSMWLTRHTIAQLQKLCKEWKLSTKIEKRSELVKFILESHTPSNILPLPKVLK